jgi:ribosomal protein S9
VSGPLEVKYPHVTVELAGQDGNAGAIVGTVARALLRAGVSHEEVQAYRTESYSGDYDHLLQTAIKTVNVE